MIPQNEAIEQKTYLHQRLMICVTGLKLCENITVKVAVK